MSKDKDKDKKPPEPAPAEGPTGTVAFGQAAEPARPQPVTGTMAFGEPAESVTGTVAFAEPAKPATGTVPFGEPARPATSTAPFGVPVKSPTGTAILDPGAPVAGTPILQPAAPAIRTAILDPAAAGVAPVTKVTVDERPLNSAARLPRLQGGDSDPLVGRELGGYTIRRKLAEGGMGIVYEGVHGKIGRTAAIKVLKPEFCLSEDVVDRFHQEAVAVNSIRHENIVDIYDFGRDAEGRVFFVMEYLEGQALSARIQRGPIPWAEAFPILDQTLRALKAAHEKRFVHRDLKPDNIWLKAQPGAPDGQFQVKLLDFGIAKLIGADSPKARLTQTGSMIGTPHYMSPEQINGARDIDQRTDIYAMGVITYEMFAGVTPFVGETLQAIMTGHLFKEPPRLHDLPGSLGVPAPIADIVDRMLVKDAAGRYDSVTDVLSDLYLVNRDQRPAKAETLNRTMPTRAPVPAGRPAAAPARRPSRALAVGGTLAVVGIAGIAGVALWRSRQAPPPVVVTAPPPPPPPAPPPAPPALDYAALRRAAETTLRASLRETEPAVRVQGSDALAKIKDRPSVPALTELTAHDPDGEVRGHSAAALGALGEGATSALLAKLEAGAPPPLKVWYAAAQARLHDKGATKRLAAYARSKDLAVSFPAGLMLADLSPRGDKAALAAIKAVLPREAQLVAQDPYAGVTLATKLTALGDAGGRKYLYGLLDSATEGTRLAAAEGLALLGHEAGKKVLQDVLSNSSSPNRLVAAVAQVPLGEYGGLDVMTGMLTDKAPENRRLAARGLGDIADRQSLRALAALAGDPDWTVRLAAARAIVAIVGLDPRVLAQASVDWTKSALDSQDLAVRRAAAGVLADIPATDAVPLLALAIADKDPGVRRAASKSAGRMKTAAAAAKVAEAVKGETDPAVKEQQVKALGEIGAIGSAASHDTLARIADEPGRIGVLAAGSLIAVGDVAGNVKLAAAGAARETELRLAAMEAAGMAGNPIVVPTLKLGVVDRVWGVRFMAAVGLATYNTEKAAAVPVLNDALGSKDIDVVGRALAALIRFGESIKSALRTPTDMLESTDARQRLAVVPAVSALPAGDAVPLLRRLVADTDEDVRHAAVDAIADVSDRDQASRLYKPLVTDSDPVVRAKAAGQLARILPPIPPQPAPVAQDTPPADTALPNVQQALATAKAAADQAKTETEAVDALLADLTTTLAAPARDDDTTDHVKRIKAGLDQAPAKLEAAVAAVEAAAKAATDAAGPSPSPEAAKLIAEAGALAQRTRDAAAATRGRSNEAAKKAHDFVADWTGDAQLDIDTANAKIAVGSFTEAKRLLDRAARQLRASGTKPPPAMDYSYAQLYDRMAGETDEPAAKRKLLQQASDAYRRVSRTGAGRFVEEANARLTKLPDEIRELGSP